MTEKSLERWKFVQKDVEKKLKQLGIREELLQDIDIFFGRDVYVVFHYYQTMTIYRYRFEKKTGKLVSIKQTTQSQFKAEDKLNWCYLDLKQFYKNQFEDKDELF